VVAGNASNEINIFRKIRAKLRAAQDGLSMRELFVRALQSTLADPTAISQKKRVDFPLIRAARNAPRLTFKQVSAALNLDEDISQ
jgi:hypothetical protein